MKYTLLLLTFFVCSFCEAQKDTTAAKSSSLLLEIITLDNGLTIQLPKQDTIPVIMLVCDTSFVPNFYSTFQISDDLVYDIPNRMSMVWWQFGYEVINRNPYTWPYLDISYLDKDKKPLPKSIVVWLTKEINQ